MNSMRRIAIAALATLGIAAASAGPANAQWHHHGGFHHFGGFHHGFHHHFGPRFGFAVGFGAPYYAPYAYSGPDCFIRRRIFINRFGEQVIRRVRVCY